MQWQLIYKLTIQSGGYPKYLKSIHKMDKHFAMKLLTCRSEKPPSWHPIIGPFLRRRVVPILFGICMIIFVIHIHALVRIVLSQWIFTRTSADCSALIICKSIDKKSWWHTHTNNKNMHEFQQTDCRRLSSNQSFLLVVSESWNENIKAEILS